MVAAFLSTVVLVQANQAVPAEATVSVQVDGAGYMRFAREGEAVYSKRTTLTVRAGKVCSTDGPWLLPVMVVEGSPKSITVDMKGHVTVGYADGDVEVGRISLAQFSDDLRPVESRGFLTVYGEPTLGGPGEKGYGVIKPWEKMASTTTTMREAQTTGSGASGAQAEGTAKIKVYAPEPESTDTVAVKTPSAFAANYKPDPAFLKAGGIVIALDDSATVDDAKLYLGAIATVFAKGELASSVTGLDLGDSPNFGVLSVVTQSRIKAAFLQMGIKDDRLKFVGATLTKVGRSGQTISQDQFVETAIAAAKERFGDVEIENGLPVPELDAPKGDLQLIAENVMKSGNSVSVTVVAYVDGKRINARTLKLYNPTVPVTLVIGQNTSVVVVRNGVGVETTGRVKKIDGVTGVVTVELETGAILTGKINKKGQVEVQA